MSTFKLKVITPEKIFFEGEVIQLIVKTTEGMVGILANHVNYCAILPSGEMKIKLPDNTIKKVAISSGSLNVFKDKTMVLASACEWSDEIDLQWAKRSEEDARRKIQEHVSDQEFEYATLKLKRALNRISVGNKK